MDGFKYEVRNFVAQYRSADLAPGWSAALDYRFVTRWQRLPRDVHSECVDQILHRRLRNAIEYLRWRQIRPADSGGRSPYGLILRIIRSGR